MYSIIIVDDAQIIRSALHNYIKKMHKDFRIAGVFSNGAEAVSFLREHPVNIVITDIVMPEMDGLALSEYIYRNFPGIITILISSYSEFEYARKAISYGVSTYLLKPLDFAELSQNLLDLKQKLDTLHNSIHFQEEDIQIFFTDLICGRLTSLDELEQRFSSLTMSGKLSEYKGCLLTLNLDKKNVLLQWQYGLETLTNALLNGIRMSVTACQCYYLFQSGARYFFLLLNRQEIPAFSLDAIENVFQELLHFHCKLQIQTRFSNIAELISYIPLRNEILRHTRNDDDFNNDEQTLQKIISYIQQHYAEDISREEVADKVFLSVSYFSRFFKQRMGVSFSDYLISVRMEEAKKLLLTRMKVGDIAKKVGFQSLNRFFINFRQYTGFTPNEYRRQVLKIEYNTGETNASDK